MQAAIVNDGNVDSENDFEDDFGGSSSVASSSLDRGEDDLAPVSNPDILPVVLQRVELQRRSTGFDYDNDQESEDDASSDGDDSVNRFGSNRIQTKGGVPSRPKAKYGSRTMRRDLRRAGGFDSEEDSDEGILGSTIFASGPDQLEAASANTSTSHANAHCAQSSSSCRLLRFGTQGDHQPGDNASLPGTTTKLSQRSSLGEYIDPSRTKRGKTVRAPVDFRRLIVVVAVCAAMTFTIGLSRHGMGHVDKQIAKQIQELERRAKEMQSPSEQLRSAMYANSLQKIPDAEESKEDSFAVDGTITATNMATSTVTSTPHIGGKPPPLLQDQAEELSNEHNTIEVQDLLPEAMNNPDLGNPSSKTLPTGSTTTVGSMSSQQDVQHLPHMEQLKKLSPEIMKILTPEQQQQFLIMTFQRMQYQNQIERMKAAISKAPEEVKRLLGIPLEAVKRRMNLRHQNKGNLRKMQNALPAEVIEISPEENLYYEP